MPCADLFANIKHQGFVPLTLTNNDLTGNIQFVQLAAHRIRPDRRPSHHDNRVNGRNAAASDTRANPRASIRSLKSGLSMGMKNPVFSVLLVKLLIYFLYASPRVCRLKHPFYACFAERCPMPLAQFYG